MGLTTHGAIVVLVVVSHHNLLHNAVSASAINAQGVQNYKFAQTADFRVEAQRSLMLDGRSVWADVRVIVVLSKLYRCSDASFDAKASSDLRKR